MGESEFGVGVGDAEVVLKGQHFSLRIEPEFTLLFRTRRGPFGILPST